MLCRRYDGGCFAAPISLGPADTLPPLLLLLWRMLCRRVCAAVWSSLADDSPLWSCLFWWMLGHSLVVFVVCWRPRCCCSSCRFICVRCFVGLGGLVRSSALWSSFCWCCGCLFSLASFQFFPCCYSFVCLCRSTTVWLASSYVCNLLPS